MRRLAAHLALVAIYAGFFSPLLVASEQSSVPACCRRSGMHHCQETSNQAGFHSAGSCCPYATPLPLSTFTGIETSKFNVSSPAPSGFILGKIFYIDSSVAVADFTPRGPPPSLFS
jgi:hypothetical protein